MPCLKFQTVTSTFFVYFLFRSFLFLFLQLWRDYRFRLCILIGVRTFRMTRIIIMMQLNALNANSKHIKISNLIINNFYLFNYLLRREKWTAIDTKIKLQLFIFIHCYLLFYDFFILEIILCKFCEFSDDESSRCYLKEGATNSIFTFLSDFDAILE